MDGRSHRHDALPLFAGDVPASSSMASHQPSGWPTFQHEIALWQQGHRCIAGVDEVGRGPLAGPVVAAAVVLFPPPEACRWIERVRDSKLLSARQREELAGHIIAGALTVGVGVVPHDAIDRDGIVGATHDAMLLALRELTHQPDFILVDGRERLPITTGQRAIIKGDRSVLSIAAASIVAKVHRDRIMQEMEQAYPGWGFGRHKGYGTAQHLEALLRLGPSPVHRRSFSPLAQRSAGIQARLHHD